MAELDDKVIVTKDKITTIADTIREEGGTSDLMTLDEMPDNIRAISGGGSADVKRLGITLANNTAHFNLNGREIWQLIGSNKTIVADITYIDGSNDRSYNKSCTASLKSEAGDRQTRIEASVVIYKNYKFYVRYFNMVIGASSTEYTGTYDVTDIEIPEVTDANPFFVCTNNAVTCSKTFAEIEAIYGTQNVNKAIAPQLVYRTSSSGAYGTRSIYGVVTQLNADRFSFKFNMGYSTGAQWQERIIVIEYRRGDILTKLDDYDFEYQKPIIEGDGINITTQGTGNNRKSEISVDSSMIMIGNASGSVASFVDGGNDIPLKSCIVAIEPVQSGSGDPSPSNVRPISGWTECNVIRDGENLWDEEWEIGTINVTTGAEVEDNTRIRNKGYIPIKENTTYHFTVPVNDGRIVFYKADKTYLSSMAGSTIFSNKYFTSLSGAYYVRFSTIPAYGTTYNNDISINYPSTDTDYHAYNGNTYNIEFPSEVGTVYGGTLDVTNGVLTVDRAIVLGSSLSWTYESDTTPKVFRASLPEVPKILTECISSSFGTWTGGVSTMPDKYCGITGTQAYPYLRVRDDDYTDATTFGTSVASVQFVYKLVTPTTYNLTPTEIKTLLGTNNIFADCGDVDVEYVRDATSIINWLISQINLGA